MKEVELRPLLDTIGYAAGSDGNIYSFHSRGAVGRGSPKYKTTPRKLAARVMWDGSQAVSICWRGVSPKKVHRLVAEAFHGPCPPGLECSHLNGNKQDNRPENLAWETSAQNNRRKRQHGTLQAGERNPSARLTNSQARQIRQRRHKGETIKSLATEFHVSLDTIWKIGYGISYKEEDVDITKNML